MAHLCVFCGSKPGADPVFVEAARTFGALMANQQCSLVYGGGSKGMMGAIADAVLEASGEVIGVVPKDLFAHDHLHRSLTRTVYVSNMSERKNVMTDMSQGFVVLPGGLGTLDELFELWANKQLDLHGHPIGLLNTRGYYDSLLEFLRTSVAKDYVSRDHYALLKTESDPKRLLQRMLEDS